MLKEDLFLTTKSVLKISVASCKVAPPIVKSHLSKTTLHIYSIKHICIDWLALRNFFKVLHTTFFPLETINCCSSQNDRKKAQNAMDAAWKAMEKKEKIPWIKKAAEDQKRYEVQYRTVVSDQTF